ncbi:hypothetical protein CXB51_026557 [Gossypium anomalum]|uniref:t-SNARE coiled-coil homology domain-containing protein n=1 Tax=Gossypium anomalum TaxID=47600 RepID=A0A8J6CSC4_9ROSI|nr:hypothetical protein CXB51_026557 [Gossypium anomalum]
MGLEADVASSEPPGKKLIFFQCNQRALRTLTLLSAFKFKLKHDMSMIINPLHSVFGISHHFRELNASFLFPNPFELCKTTDLHYLVFLKLAAELLPRCLKLKIHFTSSKKRFKNLLISFNQVFINGKEFSPTLENKYISRQSYLLFVRASNGRKVDELNKTIDVAARDPSWYGINNGELESQRRWTITARTQVGDVKKSVVARKENGDDLGTEMDSTTNRLDFVQKKVAMVMKKASAKGQIMMILFFLVLFIILFILVFLT